MTSIHDCLRFSRNMLIGASAALLFAVPASAMPITKQLVVTVIQVCDDAGTTCASTGPVGNAYYEAESDKIWAQAGIDISFVSGGMLNSTTLLTGATGVGNFTGSLAGPGTTMWLVDDLVCAACTLYGEAYLDAGGLVINMGDVTSFNGGIGRLDTIAHELGHNLGLFLPGGHDNSDPNFLIASGSVRNVPSSMGEICPDPTPGTCYSLLSTGHIDTARSSHLLIDFNPGTPMPEPGGLALVAIALLGAGVARRRKD